MFGYTHGNYPPYGKQLDVGVDNIEGNLLSIPHFPFFPWSEEQIIEIMKTREDNKDLIRGDRHRSNHYNS